MLNIARLSQSSFMSRRMLQIGQNRTFKNFGHKPVPPPFVTVLWHGFLTFTVIGCCFNWRGLGNLLFGPDYTSKATEAAPAEVAQDSEQTELDKEDRTYPAGTASIQKKKDGGFFFVY